MMLSKILTKKISNFYNLTFILFYCLIGISTTCFSSLRTLSILNKNKHLLVVNFRFLKLSKNIQDAL